MGPAADYILVKAKTGGHAPTLGIICGSGLGELAAMVEKPVVLPYADIPGFPVSTAPGHQGKLIIGRLNGMTVILMEGHDAGACDADGRGKHVGCYKCGWKHQPPVS